MQDLFDDCYSSCSFTKLGTDRGEPFLLLYIRKKVFLTAEWRLPSEIKRRVILCERVKYGSQKIKWLSKPLKSHWQAIELDKEVESLL
jgi:hypothetical protein